MNKTFSKRLRTLSIAVFLLGAVTAGVAYAVNQVKKPKPPVGFTIISKETYVLNSTDAPPPEVAYVMTVKFRKSDGTFKSTRTGHATDGTVITEDTIIGRPGRGVFKVDPVAGELTFLSQMGFWKKNMPVYDWSKDPLLVREDRVLGYKTYVVRRHDEDDASTYIDSYYAPALHNYPIKEVRVSPIGTATDEAIKIVIGNPSEQELGSLPDWPVKYELFEQKIQAMEDSGKHEVAEEMRQELQQRVQPKPDK